MGDADTPAGQPGSTPRTQQEGLPHCAEQPAECAVAGMRCRFVVEPDIQPEHLAGWPAQVLKFAAGEPAFADAWLSGIAPSRGAPCVFVTRKPVATAHCAAVFGYASRRARAAVVSLAGLDSDGPELTRRRLAAVAAHELGHLAGYRHCRTPGCLMRPAESVQDLDARQPAFCPSCRRRRRFSAAAGLLILCLAASLLLDAAIEQIRNRTHVFSWRLDGATATLLLEGEPVLRLRNPAAAQDAADALNQLYASMSPPPLHLDSNAGSRRIVAGQRQIVPLPSVDTGGLEPEEFARRWITGIDPVIQGKGTVQQGCPSCHIDRRGEVLDAMARRSRWWR